jgi:3-oxoacyl-[acyl-carrier protein] reductase/meso-butanediol dehydrogenase/(S,S)-butanediol dehydrogenase/diacetyl reductase
VSTLSPRRLEGRVALVTGAGRRRGIGAAVALELARSGAAVAVHGSGRDPEELGAVVDELGGRALAIEADLTEREAVAQMVREVRSRLGAIDVLVNNAGVAGSAGLHDLLELDDEVWYRTVDANLNAVYLVTKAVLRGMVDAGRGSIVNIGSIAGRVGQPRMGAYCATKFALVGLTQQLALEFAPAVRVNCVCPGSTDTDMMDGTFARRDQLAGAAPGTAKAARIASLPLGRQGLPADIARAVTFLASDDAGWITGQTLNVDGGQRLD